MTESPSISLLGLRCLKIHANTVKKILIKHKYLNFEAKILSKNESVIFPLVKDISLELLKPEYFSPLSDFVFEVERHSFEIRSLKSKNISEALQSATPVQLHPYLPRSYDFIGDILCVKLDDIVLSHKYEIGAVYLANLNIRSVFHKVGDVHSSHRVASWECIAGLNDTLTQHKMNGLDFFVDIEKVYFNPRLNNEYLTLAKQFQNNETIWDLFCGVGSFTLTLASKKPVTIHAIDINPTAIKILEKNLQKNSKKLLGKIFSYNADARDIIPNLPPPDRIFMNLPEKAKDYLPDVLTTLKVNNNRKVTIYLYHFSHKELTDKDDLTKNMELQVFVRKIKKELSLRNFDTKNLNTRIVRVVSPSKTQFVTEIIIKSAV